MLARWRIFESRRAPRVLRPYCALSAHPILKAFARISLLARQKMAVGVHRQGDLLVSHPPLDDVRRHARQHLPCPERMPQGVEVEFLASLVEASQEGRRLPLPSPRFIGRRRNPGLPGRLPVELQNPRLFGLRTGFQQPAADRVGGQVLFEGGGQILGDVLPGVVVVLRRVAGKEQDGAPVPAAQIAPLDAPQFFGAEAGAKRRPVEQPSFVARQPPKHPPTAGRLLQPGKLLRQQHPPALLSLRAGLPDALERVPHQLPPFRQPAAEGFEGGKVRAHRRRSQRLTRTHPARLSGGLGGEGVDAVRIHVGQHLDARGRCEAAKVVERVPGIRLAGAAGLEVQAVSLDVFLERLRPFVPEPLRRGVDQPRPALRGRRLPVPQDALRRRLVLRSRRQRPLLPVLVDERPPVVPLAASLEDFGHRSFSGSAAGPGGSPPPLAPPPF